MLEAETGRSNGNDEINVLTGGDYYGWPTSAGTVPPAGRRRCPSTVAPPAAARSWTARSTSPRSTGGRCCRRGCRAPARRLRPGKFAPELKGKYGRLKTVVAADDGALWLTTSNRDGQGTPVPDDERVIRYVPSSTGGGKNPA